MKIVDMHCDTLALLYNQKLNGKAYDLGKNDFSIDIEKLRNGDWLLQNFACFISLRKTEAPFEYVNGMIDLFEEQMNKYNHIIRPVKNYKDIENNIKNGFISAMLTVEEGQACEGDLEKLEALYARGVRMMTLTWNFENSLGYPNKILKDANNKFIGMAVDNENGLKKKGKDFVCRMQELGMIVDVSHLNDAGIMDVLDISNKPFVASHSNARGICNHPRNLSDTMIKEMANRGCVAGLNFCPVFLRDFEKEEKKLCYIKDCIRQLKYMVDKGGIDFVGLGSDYDGIDDEIEWKDASGTALLIDGLSSAGFTSSQIDKILYGNVLRLYKEVLL